MSTLIKELLTEKEIMEASSAMREATTILAYCLLALFFVGLCLSSATIVAKSIGCFVLGSTLPVLWFADYNAEPLPALHTCNIDLAREALLGWLIQALTAFIFLGSIGMLSMLFTK